MKFYVNVSVLSLLLSSFVSCGNDKVNTKYEKVYETSSYREAQTYNVTDKFGALSVKTGKFQAKTAITPWSSWWYPLGDKTLFESQGQGAATLEKYDFYAAKSFDMDTQAAQFEEQELYRENEAGWAGLCHAWAIASVLHPEPSQEKMLGSVRWSVGDQKALLLKTYEKSIGISQIMYGKRYDGNRSDDYMDIYPDQFHRFVQYFIFEKGLPFLMDYDPRPPVWTVPVYQVSFNIERLDDMTVKVDAWITFASPHVQSRDFVGTKKISKHYAYELTGEWKGGAFQVSGGEWTQESLDDHPDYVIAYPDSIERGSNNTEITLEVVDSILRN